VFLPATPEEVRKLGWTRLDVILITGDSYVDSPFIGVAVIGKRLLAAGYRVGIIPQPDRSSGKDITRLGEPALFWGVTGGCIDSLIANRTASGKRRQGDDFTAGGINNRRPDRAVIAYANLIRSHFKETAPIVLGGIEASLRRIAHYDFWSNRVRRSILMDAKADFILYGMADNTVLELAASLRDGRDVSELRGLCYAATRPKPGFIEIPSWEEAATNPAAFEKMFLTFQGHQDFRTAQGLIQKQDTRWLIHNPPPPPLSSAQLDEVHAMDFEREAHPSHRREGEVRALQTIRFSLTTHRGCYGGCHFCAIAVHEGRQVSSRSEESILREARTLATLTGFKGRIHDVGGPTANMYGFECRKKLLTGACSDRSCLHPDVCPNLHPDHRPQIALLRKLREIPGIRQAIVASGIRYDLLLADRKQGIPYLREVIRHHISGQMKIAPEHSEERVLKCMGKPGRGALIAFHDLFCRLTAEAGKDQYLTYYLIAAHPGCTQADMEALRRFAGRELALQPEQVQLFTPAPATISTLMYHTGRDPWSGKRLFVEKTQAGREFQKKILVAKNDRLRYESGATANQKGGKIMGKDKDVKKDTKKKPTKSPKEKKEAKRLKKTGKAGEI